jgi:hypothetical protein
MNSEKMDYDLVALGETMLALVPPADQNGRRGGKGRKGGKDGKDRRLRGACRLGSEARPA